MNTATTTAVGAGDAVLDSDLGHHFSRSVVPAIDIEKLINGEDADSAPGPFLGVGSIATSATSWRTSLTVRSPACPQQPLSRPTPSLTCLRLAGETTQSPG